MNNIVRWILFLGLAMMMVQCQVNDPIKELGQLGAQAPNIYFLPIDPLINAGSKLPCEIEYWSADDDIVTQSLWHQINTNEEYEIQIKGISYTFKYSFDTLFEDKKQYKEYPFDFTDWVPERSAYVFKTNYEVERKYAAQVYKGNKISKEAFNALLSNRVKVKIANTLLSSKTLLKKLLVDQTGKVEDTAFELWYQNGVLTESGAQEAFRLISELQPSEWIGNKYKFNRSYKVYLSFKVLNGLNEENESRTRSFKVK